jgi:hypothetical protein
LTRIETKVDELAGLEQWPRASQIAPTAELR